MLSTKLLTALLITAFVLALITNPVITNSQGGISNRLRWIYKGLRVTYFVLSMSTQQAPWSQGQTFEMISGAAESPASIYAESPKTTVIRLYDIYIVTDITQNGFKIRETMVNVDDGSIILNEEFEYVPSERGFHGPFWIDPAVIANVKAGDTVTLGAPPRVTTYTVLYAGRLDISPFSEGEGSLSKYNNMLTIPVPKGTYRDVVVMYTRYEGSGRLTLVVDRATGLVLYNIMGELTGGVAPGVAGVVTYGVLKSLDAVKPEYPTEYETTTSSTQVTTSLVTQHITHTETMSGTETVSPIHGESSTTDTREGGTSLKPVYYIIIIGLLLAIITYLLLSRKR